MQLANLFDKTTSLVFWLEFCKAISLVLLPLLLGPCTLAAFSFHYFERELVDNLPPRRCMFGFLVLYLNFIFCFWIYFFFHRDGQFFKAMTHLSCLEVQKHSLSPTAKPMSCGVIQGSLVPSYAAQGPEALTGLENPQDTPGHLQKLWKFRRWVQWEKLVKQSLNSPNDDLILYIYICTYI